MKKQTFTLEGKSGPGKGLVCRNEAVEIKVSGEAQEYTATLALEWVKQAVRFKKTDISLSLEHEIVTEAGIPVLYCFPTGKTGLPLVIFAHGLTGEKTYDLHNGIRLAEEGYFTVLLDARRHGERREPNFPKYFHGPEGVCNMLRVVKETAEDITRLIDPLVDDPRIDRERIGMTGISMGGHTTFAAMVRDPRIKVAAPMIGSPDWYVKEEMPGGSKFEPEFRTFIDAHHPMTYYDKIPPRALLVQNGVEDNVVPVTGVRRLDQKLKPLYREAPERYQLIEYPGVGHEVPPEMLERVLAWFRRYL